MHGRELNYLDGEWEIVCHLQVDTRSNREKYIVEKGINPAQFNGDPRLSGD